MLSYTVVVLKPRIPIGGPLDITDAAVALNTVTNGSNSSPAGWELLVDEDSDDPVYVGGEDVTTSGAKLGRVVKPGDRFGIPSSSLEGWYAIAPDSKTVAVRLTGALAVLP